ncbi:MAG: pyridoxal-5'-phosphate-dependent protein subunit beta, partial [Burkholderiales bacterium]
MSELSPIPRIVDEKVRGRAVQRLRELRVSLPTLTQLADPSLIPDQQQAAASGVDPDEPLAANLWRVHWFNDAARTGCADVPGYLVLPEA